MIKAVIFDLDGVIVSTDDCHYEAWKKMADEEGIYFDKTINNRLRGVSRMESLEIVLERAEKEYSEEEKLQLAERKNGYYDVISPITGKVFNVPQGKHWVYAPETMKQLLDDNRIYFGKDGNAFPAVKQFLCDVSGRRASSLLMYEDYGHTDMAKKDLIK